VSAAQHTPGPWYHDEPFTHVTAIHNDRPVEVAEAHYRNAALSNHPLTMAEAAANARLIAAAPDLLAALCDAEVWLRSDENDPAFSELIERAGCAGINDQASMVELLGSRCRAAIAKAEGRS
jgi:hypothetical protein